MKYKREEMLDLNETNVKNLLKYCMATKETPQNNIRSFTFVSDECEANIPKMPFDKEQLDEKEGAICYLFGQLLNLHTGNNLIFLFDGLKKYDGTTWTSDKMALFSLYYLGVATQTIPGFTPSRVPNQVSMILTNQAYLKPTLSPNDPNFEKWCRENDVIE